MHVVILGAGYGTRLTRDIDNDTTGQFLHLKGIPKPLLPIGDLPLISHWVNCLGPRPDVDVICVVTNDKFYNAFAEWKKNLKHHGDKVVLYNDFSSDNSGRKGAVADIQLAVDSFDGEQDVLVIAGDTLFYSDFSVDKFVERFVELQLEDAHSSLIVHTHCPEERVSRHGIVELDEDGKVVKFLEKPRPEETSARNQSPCFYLLAKKTLPLIDEFLESLKDAPLAARDATGNFLAFLISRAPVYSFGVEGRHDVGGLQSYVECHQHFVREAQQKII